MSEGNLFSIPAITLELGKEVLIVPVRVVFVKVHIFFIAIIR